MRVMLDPAADALWLDLSADAASLYSLLEPFPGERMEAFPVNSWVSDPKHKGRAA
jgi:putative SOS response-associated peptidase YedK